MTQPYNTLDGLDLWINKFGALRRCWWGLGAKPLDARYSDSVILRRIWFGGVGAIGRGLGVCCTSMGGSTSIDCFSEGRLWLEIADSGDDPFKSCSSKDWWLKDLAGDDDPADVDCESVVGVVRVWLCPLSSRSLDTKWVDRSPKILCLSLFSVFTRGIAIRFAVVDGCGMDRFVPAVFVSCSKRLRGLFPETSRCWKYGVRIYEPDISVTTWIWMVGSLFNVTLINKFRSIASLTRSPQYWLPIKERLWPRTKSEHLARVKPTFIRRISAKKPIPLSINTWWMLLVMGSSNLLQTYQTRHAHMRRW